jgi:DNA modification methylase
MLEWRNKILEGDCLEIMPHLPNHSVDLVLCDLPYAQTNSKKNRWDKMIPLEPLWEQYRRILKPTGTLIFTACQPFTSYLVMSNLDWFRYTLVWQKNKASDFLNSKRKPLKIHEDIVVFSPKKPVYHPQYTHGTPYIRWNTEQAVNKQTNYGDIKKNISRSDGKRYPTTVLTFDRVPRPKHPTEKPVKLAQWLIRTYSNPGDMVLDNACGAGSFLVAAVMEGREYCGIELNNPEHFTKKSAHDYIALCEHRIQQVVQQKEPPLP